MVDERKKIFIETVETLFKVVKYDEGRSIDVFIPDEAIDFFEDYKKGNSNKLPFTEKGIKIIKALRDEEDWITAKDLGEKLDISGRSVSGSCRKLIADGYVEKRDDKPAGYRITELGKACDLEVAES